MRHVHLLFLGIAQAMAILGGVVLTGLVLLTVVSVIGRELASALNDACISFLPPDLIRWIKETGIGAVTGDFELTQAGMAFIIFTFLPLAQLSGAHAVVDIVIARLSGRASQGLIAAWEIVMAVVLIIIAWRLYAGMLGKMRYHEMTYMLQFPVWWAYAAAFAAASLAAVVGCYAACARLAEFMTGRDILPAAGRVDS